MSEKKNKFRYSSPLRPQKLTLFRKTKENSSHDEDVFEQISKILDDSDLSTQETKYIAEDGKNDDFNENLENVEYEKNDLSFSKSKIEKTAHDFPEDKTNDVNLMSGEQKLSLQPISNASSLDRQFIVTKKCEDDKITEDVLLKECSKEKITLKKDHESLNKENLLTKVTDMSFGSRKKRMTAFDVCSLIFEKLKDNDDKITKLRKKSIKYEFRISEFKEKIRSYEKSKDELTKEKENIYNEKRLSDEKYEIVSVKQ